MGIVRFDIELDNPTKAYIPGSVLSGKVHLDLDAPERVKSIKITILGLGEITSLSKIRSAGYPFPEFYINEDMYLRGPEDGEKAIPQGEHVYLFSIKLPENIPPSYRDGFGTIEYSVNVLIQRVWYLWNDARSEEFKVLGSFDLNSDHRAAESVRQDTSKTFMGCSNPVDVTVRLPHRGYIPGQKIPITVDIRNGTRVNIKGIFFTLMKVNSCHRDVAPRKEKVALAVHYKPLMKDSGNIETRNHHLMQIPLVQPSSLNHSQIIDLQYLIRIEVRTEGIFRKNIKLYVPIKIGTVALRDTNAAASHCQGVIIPQLNNNNDFEKVYS